MGKLQVIESGVQETERSASHRAYVGIMNLILHHQLRPGERTSVNLLAARLGIGRTPVKEAITRLEAEGLLSVSGRSGTMVNSISREQAEQLFALRQVLEDFAAVGAVKNVTADQLKKLRTLLGEMRLHSSTRFNPLEAGVAFVRANVAFHTLIVAAAGNQYLFRLYSQLQLHLQIVTYLVGRGFDQETANRRQEEHEAIVRALAARDAKALKRALRSHSQTTEAAILANLVGATRMNARRPSRGKAIGKAFDTAQAGDMYLIDLDMGKVK